MDWDELFKYKVDKQYSVGRRGESIDTIAKEEDDGTPQDVFRLMGLVFWYRELLCYY